MGRKAQAWGFDLVIGLTIFLIGLISLFLYTLNFSGSGEQEILALQGEANLVADSLMTEGSPVNWNAANVERIGLFSDGRVNQTKVNYFRTLNSTNYALTKSLFRISREYYVYFDEQQANGIGYFPANPANLARVTRVVIYNQNVTTLNVYVWN